MSIKTIVAAIVAGGAAYVLLKAAKFGGAETQERVVYVTSPAPEITGGLSGAQKALGLFDIGLGLLDSFTGGQPLFGGSGGVSGTSGGDSLPPVIQAGYETPSGGGGLGGLFDVIGAAEAPQGYDQVYSGSKVQPPRRITSMTVSEVMAWQSISVAAGSVSSAAGRYQIIRKTLQGLVSSGVLRGGELFNRSAQDRAAQALAEGRGLSQYQSGKISAETFANNLAREWAGLPVATGANAGKSHYHGYAGNSATVTVNRFLDAIRGI